MAGAAAVEVFLGAGHAGEAGGGEREDAQDFDGLGEGADAGGLLDDAAHEDAQHGHFLVEPFEIGFGEVDEVGLAEFARIKAMFEGVEVVEGGAAEAADRRGGGVGHGWEAFLWEIEY